MSAFTPTGWIGRLLPARGRARSVGRLLVGLLAVGSAPAGLAAPSAAESWTKVRGPYFTVITPAPATVARRWATELEVFRRGMRRVIKVPEDRLRPVTVVLFPTEKAMRPFKPLENGQPQKIQGIFVHHGDCHAIGLGLDGGIETVRRVVLHEAAHWHNAASPEPLPLWLEEGIAEVYSAFGSRPDGRCSVGEPLKDHLATIRRLKALDVAGLVEAKLDSLEYHETKRVSRFYALAWAATHFLLFSDQAPGPAAIARYLQECRAGRPPREAFQAGFGVSCEEFARRLEDYVRKGTYRVESFTIPVGDLGAALVSAPASDGEVALALGSLLLGTRPEQPALAKAHLQRATGLLPQDPDAWLALGTAFLAEKRHDEARECFRRAVAAGSTSYFAHYGLGSTRFHRTAPDGTGLDNLAEAPAARRDFRRAIELNPRYLPAYEGLAGLVYADDTYDPLDHSRLEQGRRLAGKAGMIDVGLAACDLKAGLKEQGRRRLEELGRELPEEEASARRLAVRLLEGEDWLRLQDRVATLFAAGDFSAAVELIDRHGGRFTNAHYRTVLASNRRTAAESARLAAAVRLANDGETAAARRSLEAIIADGAGQRTLAEARRILEALARSR